MALVEPELLRARTEAETDARGRGGGLQPAARRRRRNHIAGLVDDIEMHGVAAHHAGAVELGVLDHDDARIVRVVVRPYLARRWFAPPGRPRACAGRHA